MIVDMDSPPGAWQREHDFTLTTTEKLWREIYEQRLRDIEALKAENDQLRAMNERWVMEP
jgi:hypothetical protein